MKSPKLVFLLIVYLFNSSCTKNEVNKQTIDSSENAINELKKIVGDNGTVFKFDSNHLNYRFSNQLKSDILTLDQFKLIYNKPDTLIRIKNDEIWLIQTDIKIYSEILNDEFPGRPGLHKIKYYATPISYFKGIYGINNSISSLSVLNFWFETDNAGRVIGTPIMFYSGVNILQTWTQLVVTKIEFNPVTSTNTFSIGGKTIYGLNIYNQLVGYEHTGGFNISVNMNNSNDDDGDIRIIGWK
jgi:hypothetical protein